MSDAAISYDSRPDTYDHIGKVRKYVSRAIANLLDRAEVHDASKLVSPEVEMFDEFTPKLRDLVYGSDEYKATTKAMGPALAHHYAVNSHHPEHYEDEIRGMSLLDLIEMLCDWKAAGERHATGSNILRSIDLNQQRWGYTDELRSILENTARELGLV